MGEGGGRRSARLVAATEGWQSTPCWEWPGVTHSEGYGLARGDLAHRVLYELTIGPVPYGHELHHQCENRLCVNPLHLEPLTRAQHMQTRGKVNGWRGTPPSSRFQNVTYCKQTGRWAVRVGDVWLGRHDTEERAREVAAAYRRDHLPFSAEARSA